MAPTTDAQAINPGDQERVPIASGMDVQYRNLKSTNLFYFVRGTSADNGNPCPQAPCYLVTERPKNPAFLTEAYAVRHTGDDVVSGSPAGDLPYVAKYQTKPFVSDFTIRGDNSLAINLWVEAPFGLEWHVRVERTGDVNQLLGSVTHVDDRDYNPQQEDGYDAQPFLISKRIPLHQSFGASKTVRFEEGDRILVRVWAEEGPAFADDPITQDPIDEARSRGTWELIREGIDMATSLVVTAEDAIQAATWVQDKDDKVVTVLKNHTTREDNVVDVVLAVRSAFGVEDLDDVRPRARILLNNETFLLNPDRVDNVEMREDTGRMDADTGRRVWELPDKYWNYHDAPSGQYTAVVSAPALRDDNRSGTLDGIDLRWRFLKSDQAAHLAMYAGDVQEHTVLAGESTTFLVNVTNTGSATDTFELSLGSSALARGWRGELEADNLRSGDRLRLTPGETQLVQVQVFAPGNAAINENGLFTLEATSTLDPSATSNVALLATVDDEERRGVGLIVLGDTTIEMGTRDNATVPVYVWNRGTVPTDFPVAIDRTLTTTPLGWNATLRHGGVADDDFTLQRVPAGAIAKVDLRYQTLGGIDPTERFVVTLNATYAGNEGQPALLEVTAEVRLQGGVRVDVLKAINGDVRYMEMECNAYAACPDENGVPGGSDFRDDGLEATWFRVWVTNTGDTADTFFLSLENFFNTTLLTADPRDTNPDTGDGFYDPQDGFAPEILRRYNARDGADPISSLSLQPGETGEVYVKVPHRENYQNTPPERFEFSVVASADEGSAEDRERIVVVGNNNVRDKSAVSIEAVERADNYDDAETPKVRIGNAREDTVERLVRLGEVATYRVRVTHGASYANTTDNLAKVNVTLGCINKGDGWRARMRPLDGTDRGWGNNFTFGNRIKVGNSFEYQGYFDMEFEVQVFTPNVTRDQKPIAGEHDSICLRAEGEGGAIDGSLDVLELDTIIERLPDVELTAETRDELVQVGKTTAFVVFMDNNASAPGDVRLHAEVTDFTTDGWQVSPGQQDVAMKAHENRSIALLVTAPGNAQAGETATITVSAEWPDPRDADKPPSERQNITAEPLTLTATVVSPGTLRVNAPATTKTVGPRGQTSFDLSVLNADTVNHRVRLSVVAPHNWTGLVSRGTNTPLDIAPNEEEALSLVVQAPGDVLEGSSYAFVVKAVQADGQADDETNFALMSFTVVITEGQPTPVLKTEKARKLVERGGHTRFRVDVRNVGTAVDDFRLILDNANLRRWDARVEDEFGDPIDTVRVAPNSQQSVYVNVTAPLEEVPVGTQLPITLSAYASDFRAGSKAELKLRAVVQDYGVGLRLHTTRVDFVPGTDYTLKFNVTNRGNGNDTLNVSLDLEGLEGLWSVFFDRDEVRLNPGESRTLHAVLRSPKNPLPTPRSVTFRAWAGTVGGDDVEQWRNVTVPVVVNILDYRAQDVDEDGFLELAVDANRRTLDGFELYREIHRQGGNATRLVSLDGDNDGKIDILLDDPADVGLDGIADIYWDPDTVVVYRIQYTPDLNDDASPDYLLDTDGDGFIDRSYDTVTRTLGDVVSKRITGDSNARQYLIDRDRDGTPDRYFDPVKGIVTEVQPDAGGPGVVGIDTTGDGRTNKYYDTNSETVRDAKVANFTEFAGQYWYLFALFALVVVVFVAVLVKRRRG